MSPPFFFAKENKIDLDFNEVAGSNHMTVACDVLPTLKQGANTNQVHKLINNDDARIGPHQWEVPQMLLCLKVYQ